MKNIIHALIGNRSIDMMGVCEAKIAERANSIRNTYRMLHGVSMSDCRRRQIRE